MTSRLEKKVVTCLENKEYYEAHQVYRTLYSRMLTAKRYSELMSLLHDGAVKLFAAEEVQSAFDLCDLYATTLLESETAPSEDLYTQLDKLLELIIEYGEKLGSDSRIYLDGRNKFVSDCVTWSQKHATRNREKRRGLSALHQHFAGVFWRKGAYEAARSHMLVAEQPEVFADFLIEMHQKLGHPSEDDLFVVLAVLQLLCLHRVKTASSLLDFYAKKHPYMGYGGSPYPRPLLNFCWLLLRVLPKKNLGHFTTTIDKYQPHLNRDPNFAPYLYKISELFYGVKAPQAGGGLLGGLFKGLLGEEKKEDKEVFSDSDMDEQAEDDEDDEEEGFETADEDEPSDRPAVAAPAAPAPAARKAPIVDQMDDLD